MLLACYNYIDTQNLTATMEMNQTNWYHYQTSFENSGPEYANLNYMHRWHLDKDYIIPYNNKIGTFIQFFRVKQHSTQVLITAYNEIKSLLSQLSISERNQLLGLQYSRYDQSFKPLSLAISQISKIAENTDPMDVENGYKLPIMSQIGIWDSIILLLTQNGCNFFQCEKCFKTTIDSTFMCKNKNKRNKNKRSKNRNKNRNRNTNRNKNININTSDCKQSESELHKSQYAKRKTDLFQKDKTNSNCIGIALSCARNINCEKKEKKDLCEHIRSANTTAISTLINEIVKKNIQQVEEYFFQLLSKILKKHDIYEFPLSRMIQFMEGTLLLKNNDWLLNNNMQIHMSRSQMTNINTNTNTNTNANTNTTNTTLTTNVNNNEDIDAEFYNFDLLENYSSLLKIENSRNKNTTNNNDNHNSKNVNTWDNMFNNSFNNKYSATQNCCVDKYFVIFETVPNQNTLKRLFSLNCVPFHCYWDHPNVVDRFYLQYPRARFGKKMDISSVNFANDITYLLLNVYQDYCLETTYNILYNVICQASISNSNSDNSNNTNTNTNTNNNSIIDININLNTCTNTNANANADNNCNGYNTNTNMMNNSYNYNNNYNYNYGYSYYYDNKDGSNRRDLSHTLIKNRKIRKNEYFSQISNDIIVIITQYATDSGYRYDSWFNYDIWTNTRYCDQALDALNHRYSIGKQEYVSYHEYVTYLTKKKQRLLRWHDYASRRHRQL